MSTKDAILNEALANIEKQFGKWAVMKMGDAHAMTEVKTFHSGSYTLDLLLGWWYPEWRVVEIYGPESSGKTTFALHAISEVQKMGEFAAFIDAEHAMDPSYASKLGVDTDKLILSQPDYGEQALQIAEELAKSWAVKLIVIDSVSALVPKSEVEWDMGDSHMGLQARMMSQWLRKITSILSKTGTTIMFINQIRMKIGVMFGNPETTSGWNALKFFASQRLEIRRWEKLEIWTGTNKEQIGYKARLKIVKNKIAPPFKKAEIVVMFNQWIAQDIDLVDTAMYLGIIDRKGAFYTIGKEKIQWKEKVMIYLWEHPEVMTMLQDEIQKEMDAIKSGEKRVDDIEEIKLDPEDV